MKMMIMHFFLFNSNTLSIFFLLLRAPFLLLLVTFFFRGLMLFYLSDGLCFYCRSNDQALKNSLRLKLKLILDCFFFSFSTWSL